MRSEDYARLLKDQYVGRHEYLLREQERITAERDLQPHPGNPLCLERSAGRSAGRIKRIGNRLSSTNPGWLT
ncbi:MAG TPA: hypothetical protein ACQGQI_06570 [Xylella sp.]